MKNCLKDWSKSKKAASRTGDYHSETDNNKFTRWVERLIPNLDQLNVIVMENASFRRMTADKYPTSSTRKADI